MKFSYTKYENDAQDYNFREAVYSDAGHIAALEKEIFPIPWSKDSLKKELKNPNAHYFVCEYNGSIVAYGGMWLIMDEAHITNIGVTHSHRKKGLGSKIIEILKNEARMRNVSSMTLEVRESNTAARNLYEKHGFENGGIRYKYYRDNKENAIIMWNFHI